MTIGPFKGDYRFLSNFYQEPRRRLLTVEHFYQSAKSLDLEERRFVMAANTPGEAKIRGRMVTIREDWESIKLSVMTEHVRTKFHSDRDLAAMLLSTGEEELVEYNTWGDIFWGRMENGLGVNHLGEILMLVRRELVG